MNRIEMLAGPAIPSLGRRRAVRYLAAVASGIVAALYFLIGFGQLQVVDKVEGDAPSLILFGLPAGSAFVLGALLLLATDRRRLWILGAAFQVLAIVMYFQVAPRRTPPFEEWGILIKLLQAGILAGLVYLVVRPPEGRTAIRRLRGGRSR